MHAPTLDEAPRETVPQDSYGQPLTGGFQRLTRTLNAIGTLWIVALMLLINSDVLGRELFNSPVRGVTELVSLSIVGIVFLQLADTLWSGRMTRADVLLDRLKRTTPALAAAQKVLADFVAEGPTEAELQQAKSNLVGTFPLRFDTNAKLLQYLSLIGFYNLPDDYLEAYPKAVAAISSAQIKAAWQRRVQPQNMNIVVVGADAPKNTDAQSKK